MLVKLVSLLGHLEKTFFSFPLPPTAMPNIIHAWDKLILTKPVKKGLSPETGEQKIILKSDSSGNAATTKTNATGFTKALCMP